MIKEAIILAGGLGTRLRSVVSDVPKCMALIDGSPFLYYIIEFLRKHGVQHFIFSVGYLHEVIENYLIENYRGLSIAFSLEREPLGTGGAIKYAATKTTEKNVLVCNGDTFYDIDINELDKFHVERNAACSLNLKRMINFDRYGVVELNDDDSIKNFKEKQFYSSGLINGGVYALNIPRFLEETLPEKFSFEKDYLEKKVSGDDKCHGVFGLIQDQYFIDIGIPEDYEKAQKDLPILRNKF